MTLSPFNPQPPVSWGGVQAPARPQVQPLGRPTFTQPTPLAIPPVAKEAPPSTNVWLSVLEKFATPFEWVDNYIIKPGLALTATTLGFVDDTIRDEGEDFWEWKKRSWSGWDAPGFSVDVPWRDDPWRIDLKGVMELAPWLLIPGVGQVGGATSIGARVAGKGGLRAASGLAGGIGKFGSRGAKVGSVLEYSPWGLLEKGVGKAFKATVGKGTKAITGATGKFSEKVGEKAFGKPPVPEVVPAVTKLTATLKENVLTMRKQFRSEVGERVYKKHEAELNKIIDDLNTNKINIEQYTERIKKARTGGIKGEFAITKENLALRQETAIKTIEAQVSAGKLYKPDAEKIIANIKSSPTYTAQVYSPEDIATITGMVTSASESGYVTAGASLSMLEMLTLGTLPEPAIIKQWAKIFGGEFAESAASISKMGSGTFAKIIDAAGIPRAIQSSTDLSGTLRQGLILTLLHPLESPKWFGRQVKALFSEKLALERDILLRKTPAAAELVKNGGYLASLTGGPLAAREEIFASSLLKHIPFLRRSERAYITYLNEARVHSFKMGSNIIKGQKGGDGELKLLANFINLASGRGNLPKWAEQYAPILNTLLYSPRYQASILGMPVQIGKMLASGNPYLRKEAGKAIAAFVGGGSAILGIVKASGGEVELDPRSSDFGKIKINETRLDIWRGYAQYSRFAAQLVTGERKSAFANINKAERSEITTRFLQTKLSPLAGLLTDIFRGVNYQGEPIFQDTTGFSKVAKERLLPLAAQDVIDAMEQNGINGLWTAIPAGLGIGVMTYINDLLRVQNKIANQEGYDSWDEIDPKRQREIENRNAELQVAMIEFDRTAMGTAWGDWATNGKAIDEVFKGNVELATQEYHDKGDGYNFRLKVNKAFEARQGGYDAREKDERFTDIVERLNNRNVYESAVNLGVEQEAIRLYSDAIWGEGLYDEFGNYLFEEADARKEQLKQSLGQEMFDYVEEYRGLKYENFPPEYQQLSEARKILKPYWEVQGEADRYFGLQDSPRKRAFISRHRKALKRSSPTIAYYLDLFYTRE